MSARDDIYEAALERARGMDASNTQASYSPRRSGGASSQIDDIYESALKKAREMDRQPNRQLTPSAPQLRDSTGSKGVF